MKKTTGTALVPVPSDEPPAGFKEWKNRFWLNGNWRLFGQAVSENRPAFVKYLHEQGFGRGAVYDAVRYGNLHDLKTLIAAGLDINEQLPGNENQTPLIRAAQKDQVQSALILVEAGADTDLRSNYNNTALILAAMQNHGAVVDLLIKAGADPTITGERNMTAKQWARHYGRLAIAAQLDGYENKWNQRHAGEAPPALPAPPPKPASLSSVWSVLQAPGTDLVVQTVDDPAAGTSVRHQFDFIAKERLTAYSRNGVPPVLTITRFTELDDGLLQTVNAVRADPAPYASAMPPKAKLS